MGVIGVLEGFLDEDVYELSSSKDDLISMKLQ